MHSFPFSSNLFWDHDLADIDLKNHRDYVITRVLTRGSLGDFETLLTLYKRNEIIDSIMKSRELDLKTAHFCSWYFKISPDQLHASPFYR